MASHEIICNRSYSNDKCKDKDSNWNLYSKRNKLSKPVSHTIASSQPSSIQHPASSIQQPANQPTSQPTSIQQPANQPTNQPSNHQPTQPNPTQPAVEPLGEGECFFMIFFLKNTPSRRDFLTFQKPREITFKMRVFFSPFFTFKMRFFVKNRRFV